MTYLTILNEILSTLYALIGVPNLDTITNGLSMIHIFLASVTKLSNRNTQIAVTVS